MRETRSESVGHGIGREMARGEANGRVVRDESAEAEG